MRVVKPKKLNKGDLIGIISPASSPDESYKIEKGVSYLEKCGYKVVVGKNVGKFHGYLAGSDEERLDDLHSMFKRKDVKAIICVRGGYGSPRLLNRIDYKIIKNNPKIFVGYSDITALQMAFYTKAGLVTFAGPMLAVDFGEEISSFTEEMFWSLVTSNKKMKIKLPDDEKLFALKGGNATGTILGGNLALITSLLGTEYLPDMKQKILFLEDIGESPYRIDRMFNQLKLAKVFDKLSGIILGAFIDCNETDLGKRTLTLGEVVDSYFSGFKKPVVYNFPHGHLIHKLTIPLGIKLKMNATKGSIEFLENAVS